MPSLIVERGQEKGFSFGLKPGAATVVGRDPANEVIISDPAASRRHFQIRSDNGRWFVADLGSRNSTYVNEDQLTGEIPLEYGDRIQVGETVFSFLEEEKTKQGKAAGLAGKDIGGYKILERIGRGGMGTVYKARQISLNRIVALKILSTKYGSDPQFVQQFVAEARSAGQLNHPNVVQVFDVGQSGGLHFFSMEFMDGGSVQDMLTQQEGSRLHWTEALPIILDAARGLVFAEKRDIIHRDIKPDNLMVTSEGKAKIGDLGLAMRSDAETTGRIFGTPHFIAPEQARGKEVTHAADIYSLGAAFYRIVVGTTPFTGQTVKEILRAQVNDAHTPVTEAVEDFPEDLSAILDKMMSKTVEGRYGSANALVEALEEFQLAHQIELAGGIRKPNKLVLVGGGVAIVGLAIAAIVLASQPDTVVNNTITETITIREGPEGPVKTAEDIRQEKLGDAENALLRLRLEKPGGDVDLARKDAWLEKADKYAALAKEHPEGGEHTQAAKDRASGIRTTLEGLEEEYNKTIGAAKTWWDGQKLRIGKNLEDGDWTAVLRDAKRLPKDVAAVKHLKHVPTAAKFLAGLEAEVVKRANASLDDALAEANRLMTAGDPGAALAYMSRWEGDMRKHDAAHEDFPPLAQSAADWVLERRDALIEELDRSRAADRMVFADAYRAIRHIAADDADSTPVFDMAFGAAAATLESSRGVLTTWIYEDRLDEKVARLQGMQVAWKAFVDKVAAGGVVSATERLVGMPKVTKGSVATLNFDKPITLESFKIKITIPGVRGGAAFTVNWKDMTREQVWDNFLDSRLDKYTPDEALGLAWVFAELGHPVAADALLARAIEGGAGNGSGFPAETETALKREIAAIQAYDALLAARDGPPEQMMQAVETWRQQHYRSDFFLLADGRPTPQLPDLFTPPELDEFVRSLGQRKPPR